MLQSSINFKIFLKLQILNLYIKYIKNTTNVNFLSICFILYYTNYTSNIVIFNLISNIYKNFNEIYLTSKKLVTFKKLSFFKNTYITSLLFYNLIHNSSLSFTSIVNKNLSNYDPTYLFTYYYYFIKNINTGALKYFTLYYQNNLFFLRFFIMKYLKSFVIDKQLFINFQKNHLAIAEKSIFYSILLKKAKYFRFLKEINLKVRTFLNLIILSLFSKDVILFKNGLKTILERLHFKKHRKFLYNLKLLLKSLSSIFFFKFKCLGLFIRIKGKIGLGGSSKKKKFVCKLGSFSFTKKIQKISYTKDSIRTYSGVLGFEMYLTYK